MSSISGKICGVADMFEHSSESVRIFWIIGRDAINLIRKQTYWVFLTLFSASLLMGCSNADDIETPSRSNGGSYNPSISLDGRYVVFESQATNLVTQNTTQQCTRFNYQYNYPGIGNINVNIPPPECLDIFIYDSETGETRIVSTNSKGELANKDSRESSVSKDGRFVAYVSEADNLIAGDVAQCDNPDRSPGKQNCADVFLKDMQTGTIKLVSANNAGEQGNGSSYGPSISADGRYVAFWSAASNLVNNDTQICGNAQFSYNCEDVFLKDIQTGDVKLISSNTLGHQANEASSLPTITADGRYVAFLSSASNLTPTDRDSSGDVFLKDTLTGIVTSISTNTEGQVGNRESGSDLIAPVVSFGGQYVLFSSAASNLVPGYADRCYKNQELSSCSTIFMKDVSTGTTKLIGPDSRMKWSWQKLPPEDDERADESHHPSITADGRYVVYQSFIDDSESGNIPAAVFLKDMLTGEKKLLSPNNSGTSNSGSPSISAFSHYVVFEAESFGSPTLFSSDIFIYDFLNDTTRKISGPG